MNVSFICAIVSNVLKLILVVFFLKTNVSNSLLDIRHFQILKVKAVFSVCGARKEGKNVQQSHQMGCICSVRYYFFLFSHDLE